MKIYQNNHIYLCNNVKRANFVSIHFYALFVKFIQQVYKPVFYTQNLFIHWAWKTVFLSGKKVFLMLQGCFCYFVTTTMSQKYERIHLRNSVNFGREQKGRYEGVTPYMPFEPMGMKFDSLTCTQLERELVTLFAMLVDELARGRKSGGIRAARCGSIWSP
jgi:hypothetical protein